MLKKKIPNNIEPIEIKEFKKKLRKLNNFPLEFP